MNTLEYIAVLLALTAGFAYANHYLVRLPRNSGLLLLGLGTALILRLVDYLGIGTGVAGALRRELVEGDFSSLLLNVFLGFLLFAATLNVDVRQLFAQKWTILALATVGVAISTFAMAAGMYVIFRAVGITPPFAACLVFGALISPTDPVTVTGVLRRLGLRPSLQAIIVGESLFNDGIGIALFAIFLAQAASGAEVTVGYALLEFTREAGGGALLGALAGSLAFAAMRGIDDYNTELMISLTLVTGTFGVAQTLQVSGPVAIVIAGLIIGSVGIRYAVSPTTHDYLRKFWSATDALLNALLFLVIGLEFALIELHWRFLAAAGLAVPLALAVRGFSITLASLPLNLQAPHKTRAITLLTWSGLRGGISVALALSLPASSYRDALVTACYVLVIFTMLVQGLTLERLAKMLYPPDAAP